MDIWSLDKLTLIITFAIPGFIALKTYGLLSASGNRDASQQILDAVAYSCINYAILAFPILYIEHRNLKESSPYCYFALWTVFLLITPAAMAGLYWCFRTTAFAQRAFSHPIGKPWDFFFSKRQPLWAVVTLKNGRKVGGWYGERSFSSSYPHSPEIYLEEAWHINEDEGLERARTKTAGILITESEISTIEFFDPDRSDEDEQQETIDRGEQIATRDEGLPASASETGANQHDGRLSANDQQSKTDQPTT